MLIMNVIRIFDLRKCVSFPHLNKYMLFSIYDFKPPSTGQFDSKTAHMLLSLLDVDDIYNS